MLIKSGAATYHLSDLKSWKCAVDPLLAALLKPFLCE